ncbi:MAG: ABC transporter permease [Flavobacteriales bacterium]|nr:ABC transporter permease [Flavobacteriales bacterium]
MNTEVFIARRMLNSRSAGLERLSGPIVKIATLAVVLGLTVMIVAVAIVTGFQQEIRDKVIGFGAHIQINNYDFNTSYEPTPIPAHLDFVPELLKTNGINHVQSYATKAGIIKTSDEIMGVVLKGVGTDFDWTFFKSKLVSGHTPELSDSVRSNDIMISKYVAQTLQLDTGAKLNMFFIQDPPRSRSFRVTGIYETGMEEFDKLYVFGDIAHIRKLNDWAEDRVAGFEVRIDDYDKLDEMGVEVNEIIGYKYLAQTVRELHPQLFDWLNLQDVNVIVILVLMAIVVIINMSTALLIMILERTQMIGILKALGAADWRIRKIFLYNAAYIIGRGMLWGNLIGIGLCLIQQKFGVIPLDQASYYLTQVPINLEISHLIILNVSAFALSLVMMVLPSYLIAQITPVKALRFG